MEQDLLPLEYHNADIVLYFQAKNPAYTEQQCLQLWQDLLAWLQLKELRSKFGKKTYLFGPLLSLDTLWHTFILHTRDYLRFCQDYFGAYVHHDVEFPGKEYQLSPDELQEYLQDCFEHLGEPWVLRYFGDYLENL